MCSKHACRGSDTSRYGGGSGLVSGWNPLSPACCLLQAVPVAKAKGKGRYLPKDVAAVAMILLTGLLIAYTGASPCRM